MSIKPTESPSTMGGGTFRALHSELTSLHTSCKAARWGW